MNCTLQKEVAEMADDNLKNLVENEWDDYHLVYMELARKEYIRRGFKNLNKEQIEESNEENETSIIEEKGKYPALTAIGVIYVIGAFIIGVLIIVLAFLSISNHESIIQILGIIVIGSIATLSLIGASELIKVIVDIEENTRRCAE
jgi:VIT1/CCC1 family predicted Fe2+/Mn2+ transporter